MKNKIDRYGKEITLGEITFRGIYGRRQGEKHTFDLFQILEIVQGHVYVIADKYVPAFGDIEEVRMELNRMLKEAGEGDLFYAVEFDEGDSND